MRSHSREAAGAAGGFGCGGGFSGGGVEPVCDGADVTGGRRDFDGGDTGVGATGADEFEFEAGRKSECARQNAAREVSFARILGEGNVCCGVEFVAGIICWRGAGSGGAKSAANLFCGRGGRAIDFVRYAGRKVTAD